MLTNYFREKTWATHTSTESISFSYCKILLILIQNVVHTRKRLYLKVEASINIYLHIASTYNINNLQYSNDSKTKSNSSRMKPLSKFKNQYISSHKFLGRNAKLRVSCLDAAYIAYAVKPRKQEHTFLKSRLTMFL